MRRALEATELTDLGIIQKVLENQHFFYPAHIDSLDNCEMIEVSLALLSFLGEDVAVVSVLPLNLARSGKRKTLFGTGVGFKLWHFCKNLNVNNILPHHADYFFLLGVSIIIIRLPSSTGIFSGRP